MERRRISGRGIPTHLCRYSILSEVGLNSPLLNYRLHIVTSNNYRMGWGIILLGET